MKTSPEKVAEALRVSIKEGERHRQRHQRLLEASREPIAIVGMSCRFPGGAGSPQQLWELVSEGRDAIGPFPADRCWDLERLYSPDPDDVGTVYSREGGFLADAADFDPAFFGISPREALGTDPQQRLLLEASWEALEDAGIDPLALRGSPTGVFAGVMYQDYGSVEHGIAPGMSASVVTGRVAYALGLEGPAMTVDTACSSSLVAMHLAAGALRQGECSLALAGGVTVLSTPGMLAFFAQQRGLAPDGRCKAFAEAADGVGFSEGVGVLALERLSDAERNGRRVLATIKGSAVNQDGASNGLTAPNGPAQERVIRQALANARLEPGDVDAVEAHGTGTTLGDPIEAGALLATYGRERETPLRLGSVKSNIGHTQAAAGVAGVIKTVMAMREGVLPKTLHVDAPSSKVEWGSGEIELLTEPTEWSPNGRPRRAGVSSFGASGTNAHLILEEAPVVGRDPGPGASAKAVPEESSETASKAGLHGPTPFVLSAKSADALRAQARRLAAHLQEHPELDPLDLAFSLATTRARLEQRAVVVGEGREELLAGLFALAEGSPAPDTRTARAQGGRLAYLFTGQGSQRPGMGKELYETYPAYAQALDEACEEIDAHLDRSLKKLIFSKPGSKQAELLDHTTWAQPALFATGLALHRLLESFGLKPELLTGHSVGEIVAAHISGVFSLPDAAKLIAARGRLMGELPEGGAMLAIEATEQEALESIEGRDQELSLAAVNGPRACVISGAADAVAQVEARWQEQGRKTKRLAVSHAFHSPLIEPMLEPFAELVSSLELNPPTLPVISNTTGEQLTEAQATDPAYWVAHAREPVRFADAIATLRDQGATTYLELGPDAVLSAMAAGSLGEDEEAELIPTLREGRDEAEAIALAFGSAHAAGAGVDWQTYFKESGAEAVSLPTYPFQRKRYWLDAGAAGSDPASIGQAAADHPLLSATIEDPAGGGLTLTGCISLQSHPWLADHVVSGAVLLPGTALVELALRAGREVGCELLEELTLQAPLVLPETGAARLQVKLGAPGEDGRCEVAIYSRGEGEAEGEPGEWTRNALGVLSTDVPGPAEPIAQWPPQGAEPVDPPALYAALAGAGLDYGPAFQGLTAAWRDGNEIYAEVSLDEGQAPEASRYAIHPALLDAAFHAALGSVAQGGKPVLPFAWSGVGVRSSGASSLRVRLITGEGSVSLEGFDRRGARLLSVGSVAGRELDPASLGAASASRSLYELRWQQAPGDALTAEELPAKVLRLSDLGFEPGEDLPTTARAATRAALEQIQAWLGDGEREAERLVLLTEGAIALGEEEGPDPIAAALWGLIRSAQSEHPGRFALIDTDASAASEAALEQAIALASAEPQLALREGKMLVPRLTPSGPAEDSVPAIEVERTVLVTGGLSGIGAAVARHLVEVHGARRLLLVGRRGIETPGAPQLLEQLGELGAQAEAAACDVSDRGRLEELLASIDPAHPLGAVIHSAGVLDDATIESLDAESLERVFAPKADGAWHLHELSEDMGLSHFVLFSSVAATLGNPGQGNYAAANAFLEALAQKRHAAGLAATAIAWGGWDLDDGMGAALSDADRARVERSGLLALSEAQGLALFDAALSSGRATVVAARLSKVPRRRQASGSLAAALAAMPEAAREGHVLGLVRSEVAVVLGHGSAAAVEVGKAFKELGFDSLAAIELRNRLGAATGIRLPATVVFDYPSTKELARYLLGQTSGAEGQQPIVHRARASEEPIAIVGMSCRFPGGAGSPQQLWELVSEGRDAIGSFPADRGWDLERLYSPDPDDVGTAYAREGGFLADAADFDPAFFGISPREALGTDPQQRLLLEASWEALEDAGIDPLALRGSPTGVFAGVMYQDYGAVETGVASGMSASVVSGRVAYTLGLEGPAMSVDTACSSSLVAMHLASQALRAGECSLALAGGVTVLSTPWMITFFAQQRGLAPDGRCKAFSEAADGLGFSEGVGVLALERLSDAERNGRRVLATIKGSAVNQDGASNGLTAPNGPAQERVIRQALANARLEPRDVDAVEAHGTGTALGDPIEAGALLATYGRERETPLRLGTVKSNIGHTQAAAGVAGVIKTVMAMREGVLPKTLHVDAPSSKVEWGSGEIELLTEPTEWRPNGRPRRAGVSSFGASGTNAHLILEEAPVVGRDPGPGASAKDRDDEELVPLAGPLPLVLSAKSEDALRAQARRLAAHLQEHPELDPLDLAFSLATTRARLEQRAVVVGQGREELLAGLFALAEGSPAPDTRTAKATSGRLAYLFTGQGSQRPGMGKELYETWPAYAQALDEACEAIDAHLDRPLKELIFSKPGSKQAELLDHTTWAQPALFATELALHRLLESFGLKPELLTGHSVGEIVAAHISGVFSLPDAAKLIAARGRLMGELPEGGAMLAIEATEQEALESIEGRDQELSLAAVNGPRACVISGAADAVAQVEARWQEQGRKTKRLAVSHAFHSPLIEPMLEPFAELVSSLELNPPTLPVISNTTGEQLTEAQATDPAYWVAHAREPVRFADAIATLREQGATTYLELGPDAVLSAMAAGSLGEDEEAELIPTLREGRDEAEAIALAFGSAHAAGAGVDWQTYFKESGAEAVPLPTYPFQRQRYWHVPSSGSDPASIGQAAADHPLLSATIEDPEGEGLLLTGRVSLERLPWLADHAAAGTVLLPGTAFVELALESAERVGCAAIEELTIAVPLALPESGGVQMQIKVGPREGDGKREISIHSRPEAEGAPWSCNARGALSAEAGELAPPPAQWPPAGAEPVDLDFLYDRLAEAGLDYGPAFQGLEAAWRVGGEEICAEVSLAPEQAREAARWGVHPALLDATLHGALLLAFGEGEELRPSLPFAWEDIVLGKAGATSLRVRIVATGEERARFELADGEGRPLARIGSLRTRPMSLQGLGTARPRQGLLALNWTEPAPAEAAGVGTVKLLRLAELDVAAPADPIGAAHAAARAALTAVQGWLATGEQDEARSQDHDHVLALLTNGAVAISPEEEPDLAGAAVWGLLRSAQTEHPGRLALIDTDGSEASSAAIPAALARCAEEPQLALREGRLMAARIGPPEVGDSLPAPLGPWVLDTLEPGTLEALSLVSRPHLAAPLGPGQVRIASCAGGLNFRDVMAVLGVYPGEIEIGGEGAGVVVEVGPEVDGPAVGDRVMGMVPGAFGPLAVAEARLLVPLPAGWRFEQGAAVPIVCMTAYFGLLDLARLRQGEKILVHAGAGGVGMAAIQLARRRGAEVFATAGPAKWEALKELGLAEDHIASSRDLGFRQRFLEQTGGEGVDVVLNSLAGEFIDASLDLLPRGGRFLEMGKTDLRDPELIASERPGVCYQPFDLREAGAQRMAEMLAEIVAALESGELRHAPLTTWDVRDAREAFRHLREGNNVGKVVLTVPRPIDPDATVLITGGTGGLGALVARHLVGSHGARRLLLLSRSGPEAEGAADLVARLEQLGASVRVEACDVSDRTQLEALLGSIDPAHPLGAVVHAAGVLADGVFESMTGEQVERVFAPKLDAAWHLHELTKDLDLSAFVLFSSIAGLLGTPGQANYAAANAFLDALAVRRQAEGLAATSIAWGLWERESGMTAGLAEGDKARMRRGGVEALSDELGLACFDAAHASPVSSVLAARIDAGGLKRLADAGALPPILSGLVPRRSGRRPVTVTLAEKLAKIPAAQHEAVTLELVREEAAAVLGHPSPEEVPPDRPFNEIGFDSLAAVELRNRLATATGQRLPATVVFDHPSVSALAEFILAKVGPDAERKEVLESGELEIREALARLPLARLRSAGLIDPLLRLADSEADPGPQSEEDGGRIDTMDVEELLRASEEGVR